MYVILHECVPEVYIRIVPTSSDAEETRETRDYRGNS